VVAVSFSHLIFCFGYVVGTEGPQGGSVLEEAGRPLVEGLSCSSHFVLHGLVKEDDEERNNDLSSR